MSTWAFNLLKQLIVLSDQKLKGEYFDCKPYLWHYSTLKHPRWKSATESSARQQNPSSDVVLDVKIIPCVHYSIILSDTAFFSQLQLASYMLIKEKIEQKHNLCYDSLFTGCIWIERNSDINLFLSCKLHYAFLLFMIPLIMTLETDVFACISINFSELQST